MLRLASAWWPRVPLKLGRKFQPCRCRKEILGQVGVHERCRRVMFRHRQFVLITVDMGQLRFGIAQHAGLVSLSQRYCLLQYRNRSVGLVFSKRDVGIKEHELGQFNSLVMLGRVRLSRLRQLLRL